MFKYGIVVIAYRNINGIKRLLKALSEAVYYDSDILLLISIDYSGNTNVSDIAYEFKWNHGNKKVIEYKKKLGLRNHVLRCGDYLNTYNLDALIVFEDDIFPARDFFLYSTAATEKFINDDNIAGVSLYRHDYNESVMKPFYPLDSAADNFFIQYAQSRGQIWFKQQWNQFREWYKKNMEWNGKDSNLPADVLNWPDSSWKRYHTKYCVEMNKYFVYPYMSRSTCFGDIGENILNQTSFYQVSLSNHGEKQYNFVGFDESEVKYDVFFEYKGLARILNLFEGDLTVDLYGGKNICKSRYLLTNKKLDFLLVNSWANKLIPHELNILYNIEGNDIHLYDLRVSHEISIACEQIIGDKYEKYFKLLCKWDENEENGRKLSEYFLKNGWEKISIYGFGMLGKKLCSRLRNSNIRIHSVVEKKPSDLKVINLERFSEMIADDPPDVVIVTPIMEYYSIRKSIKECGFDKVLSFEEVIYSI